LDYLFINLRFKGKTRAMERFKNSGDLRHSISLYFDNALNTADEKNLIDRVNADPTYSRIFNKEKNFRDFIKNNVKRPTVSPDLIQTIRSRVKID